MTLAFHAAIASALGIAFVLSLRAIVRSIRTRRREIGYEPLSRSALRIATEAARNGAKR